MREQERHAKPHDVHRRDTGVCLERAGVPRSAAMKMTGHKTEVVYRRYAIVDEAMLREVLRNSQRCTRPIQFGGRARWSRLDDYKLLTRSCLFFA